MSPFEIEARYARPMLAPVRGPPGGRFKSGSIQDVCVPRINRNVVNVTVVFKHRPPGFAGILRQEDAPAIAVFAFIPCPRRKIESIRGPGVDGQSIWTIASLGHNYGRPMLSGVR